MTKNTASPTALNGKFASELLTPKGREFMRAVGAGEFSFFDGGIVAGEGCWGSILSEEHFSSVRSASGVMGATARAGLWEVTEDSGDAGSWWSLTKMGAEVALYLAEQPVEAASAADEPVEAESTPEAASQPEKAADAVKDWRGNYNTVFAPAAELLAGASTHPVWTVNVSTMLKQTHVAGTDAVEVVARLDEVEAQAVAAMRDWQKTQDRKEQTDMERFNQNRSFLSGYLAAVVQETTGVKKVPVVAFAKDMDKALRPDAMKAGAAARKASK